MLTVKIRLKATHRTIQHKRRCELCESFFAISLKCFTDQKRVTSHIRVICFTLMVQGFCRIYTSSCTRTFGHLKSFFSPCVQSLHLFFSSLENFAATDKLLTHNPLIKTNLWIIAIRRLHIVAYCLISCKKIIYLQQMFLYNIFV